MWSLTWALWDFSKRFLKKFLEHKTRSNTYFSVKQDKECSIHWVTPAFTSVTTGRNWRQSLLCKELRALCATQSRKTCKIESPSSQHRGTSLQASCLLPAHPRGRARSTKGSNCGIFFIRQDCPSAENQVSIGSWWFRLHSAVLEVFPLHIFSFSSVWGFWPSDCGYNG